MPLTEGEILAEQQRKQNERMTLEDEVLAALAELGDTPDKVADSLKAQGIKGYCCDGTHCPVGKYLNGKFPRKKLHASATHICDHTFGARLVQTPRAIAVFVRLFDEGKYPDLIDKGF